MKDSIVYLKKKLYVFLLLLFGITGVSHPSHSQTQQTVSIIKDIGNGDFDAGLEHIAALAKDGNGSATFLIANLHLHVGNIKEFRKYLQLAAEQNDPTAIKFLATSLYKGTFSEPDYEKARAWFQRGAALRNINSMMYLGLINRDGLGTEPNPQKAYFWFSLAGFLKQKVPGQKEPEEFAEEIEYLLNDKIIHSTDEKISQWLKNNPKVKIQVIPPIK